jgi:GTPase
MLHRLVALSVGIAHSLGSRCLSNEQKSTLIGVLTGGALDDGRGKARSKVFIHAHELGTGRTSAISQHIMGFDAAGKPVHQAVAASAQSAAKSKSWGAVIAASKSIVTFTDLAGHERYLKVRDWDRV